jgi:hypothetical protein
MKQHEFWLQHLLSCLDTARTLIFALAAFSLAAIYIAVFSSAAQRADLVVLQDERARVAEILRDGEPALAKTRNFYEGPAEAEQLNFASLIYALEITQHHLQQTLRANAGKVRSRADVAFLEFQAALIEDNAFELGAIIGGLVQQKKSRVPFEALPASDLLDLDYHKGKDAWHLYYDWSSLRYALYTEASYGYRKLPDGLDSLEKRFRFHASESQKSRQSSTRPPKAGRDPAVTGFVQRMTDNGFRSLGEVRARITALDTKIREQEKSISGSLKLPFVDQSVDVDYLVWLVPLTVLISLLFTMFYALKARELCDWLIAVKSELGLGARSFPWVFLDRSKAGDRSSLLARLLRVVLIALPLGVSVLLFVSSSSAPVYARAAGAVLTLISVAAAWALLAELTKLASSLWVEVAEAQRTTHEAI